MIRLSAFADEISPDPAEQIAVLRAEGIRHIDLRGAWGVNVLDLHDRQVGDLRRALTDASVAVAAIASPIGKAPIDGPFDEHLRRFERAITLAHAFDAPAIRIFSFYPLASGASTVERATAPSVSVSNADAVDPATDSLVSSASAVDPATYRDEALRRLRELTVRARAAGLTLLHENEKDIYGDTVARCVDLLRSIDDTHFVAAFDPANYIQCGQTPYPDAYDAVRPWLRYVHVKDAHADGSVVAAGEGVSRWPDLLRQLCADGYDGVFALEPHLAAAGQFQGFSGPALFRHASQSFQRLLRDLDWDYS